MLILKRGRRGVGDRGRTGAGKRGRKGGKGAEERVHSTLA